MISLEDSYSTYEYSDYYKILPQIFDWDKDKNLLKMVIKYLKISFIPVIQIQNG